jgi:hypothetical protein
MELVKTTRMMATTDRKTSCPKVGPVDADHGKANRNSILPLPVVNSLELEV